MVRPLIVGAVLLLMANLLAIGAVPFIGFDDPDRLAILVIPTTIAATFALVREQTALAARLQWMPRLLLAATTIALWLEVVVGLILFDDGRDRTSINRPKQQAEWATKAAWTSTMSAGKEARYGKERSKRWRSNRRGHGS